MALTGYSVTAYLTELWMKYSLIPCLIGFVAVYFSYYIFYVVKKPTLSIKDGPFKQLLLRHCPVVQEYYWPTFWCFESHAQTVVRVLLQSKPLQPYAKEFVSTPDGGQLHLDWVHNENEVYKDPSTRPTLLILPGLTSTSQENYILNLVESATKLGYRCIVLHYRGLGEAKLLTPRSYCASNTEDISFVISYFKSKYPDAPLSALGISLGGIMLFNYLAQTGENSGLVGGMTVSQAFNVFESSSTLEKPVNIIFNRYLTKNLLQVLRNHQNMFADRYDLNNIYQAQTIREFDERFTAKVFGYPSCKDYYMDSCAHQKIADVKIPLLCLNSADDPFSPHHAIPFEEANKQENVAFLVTSHGGHIAFLEGILPYGQSYMNRVFAQYIEAVFKYGKDQLVSP